MSLITEKERVKWIKADLDSIIERIEERKPEANKNYVKNLAYHAKLGLEEEIFPIITSKKSIDEMVEDLERAGKSYAYSSVTSIRSGLIAAGFVKKKRKRKSRKKKYTLEDFKVADEKYPTFDSIRRTLRKSLSRRVNYTTGDIADILGIPKYTITHAMKTYGIKYRAYSRMLKLLRYDGTKNNWLSCKKVDGNLHFQLNSI